MSNNFPEFYVSAPPESDTESSPVYYKVTGKESDAHVFWRQESMSRSRETTFYDLFLEEKNGYGVSSVSKNDTPWRE